jgi:hypothetical protein
MSPLAARLAPMLDHLGLRAQHVKASLDFYPDGHNVEAVHHG